MILKASYGGFDCTEDIRKKIINNRLVIRANNEIIGDPAIGTLKYLEVDFADGCRSIIQEGSLLVYPASSNKILGVFYSNNNNRKIWPSIYKSLDSIKNSSAYKADIITCMWEPLPDNPFHQIISWYKSQSHLNQILQIMQCLHSAKEMGNYDYVCFLEHDVLYPEGYFDFPEFDKGMILTNMNYGGLCQTGWQKKNQNDEPFHQMTMHLDDAIDHCTSILPNALKTNSGNIESKSYERIQWRAKNEAIHINHGIHFTSHNSIYSKENLEVTHPYWGDYSNYSNLFV